MRARVLVLAPHFAPAFRAGGPVRSLEGITRQGAGSYDILVVARDRDLGDVRAFPGLGGRTVERDGYSVHYLDPRDLRQVRAVIRLCRRFDPDAVYLNSLWNLDFAVLPAALVLARILPGRRTVLAPRGQLGDAALADKAATKRALLAFWRIFLARTRGVVHATDDRERRQIEDHLASRRVVTSMDPVLLPAVGVASAHRGPGPLRLVHVGRLAAHKNLALVLRALRGVSRPVSLDVYGPVEDQDYLEHCQGLVAELPKQVKVRWHGPVAPDEVTEVFARHDAFVFPTKGENFGHVIAESLSRGCPVLSHDVTPFTPYLRRGGAVLEQDVDAWQTELVRWSELSESELIERREQAAGAYTAWRAERDDTSILDLVLREREVDQVEGPAHS